MMDRTWRYLLIGALLLSFSGCQTLLVRCDEKYGQRPDLRSVLCEANDWGLDRE